MDMNGHIEPLRVVLHEDTLAEDEFAVKGKELPTQSSNKSCIHS
jgi:hypothetical protein